MKTNTKFMLVYQNEAMKSILKDHGDYLFLDSTHKTNKYKMPLFQLMVFTPHGYQVYTNQTFTSQVTDSS